MWLQDLIPYSVSRRWHELRCRFFPENRWATGVIPSTHSNKSYLIPEFLYAAVIDFVEGEKALEVLTWDKKSEKRLTEVYRWAKTGRHEFQSRIRSELPKVSLKDILEAQRSNAHQHDLYAKVNLLESEYEKINTSHLLWIVKNHEIFWTT
jgi:hypothetical protein